MSRPIRIIILIILIPVLFSLGKWLIIDNLLGNEPSGRYRDTNTDNVQNM